MLSRIISTAGAVLMLAMLISPGVRAESIADVYAKIATAGVRADSAGDINQIDGLALHGFDPVAYFTQNKAVKGEPVLTASYQGVTYQFASKEDQAICRLLRPCHQQRDKGRHRSARLRDLRRQALRQLQRQGAASLPARRHGQHRERGSLLAGGRQAVEDHPLVSLPALPAHLPGDHSHGGARLAAQAAADDREIVAP